MLRGKNLIPLLAVTGLMMATQHASAAVVQQDDDMINGGTALGVSEMWSYSGSNFWTAATDSSDGNQFAILDKGPDGTGGAGISFHVDIADVVAVQPLVDGMTLRLSAWFVSDPNAPFVQDPEGFQGWKFEFFNVALAGSGGIEQTNETEFGMGLGLPDAIGTATTTEWTRTSFTVPITDFDVDFASLEEIRGVLVHGDWSGNGANGRLFVDGMTVEVFPDQATADTTPLPDNIPGGFNPVDLSGDINGDGFVGIADLNIVLGTWNNGTPPTTGNPSIPEPASLALVGIGGLAVLRRR